MVRKRFCSQSSVPVSKWFIIAEGRFEMRGSLHAFIADVKMMVATVVAEIEKNRGHDTQPIISQLSFIQILKQRLSFLSMETWLVSLGWVRTMKLIC